MRKLQTIVVAYFSIVLVAAVAGPAEAQESVELISGASPLKAWSFYNGAEFKGATGSLTIDDEASRSTGKTLKLVGDFSKGGAYVQAGRKFDDVDVRELSFRVRNPGADRLTLRLGDASGQTHQIVVRTDASDDWQQITLPLERFFARRGEADAVTTIAKYESWGGAKDGKWHGPAKAIYFLLSKRPDLPPVRTLWLADVTITPKPLPVAGAEQRTVVALDEIVDGRHDWQFSNGPEFKGATGTLAVVADDATQPRPYFRLAADFTGGGAYVAAVRNLAETGLADLTAVRFRLRTKTASAMTIQLVDGSGQTHQRRGFKISADDAWHEITLKPEEIAGGEHWGGANDGRWHSGARQVVLSLPQNANPLSKTPELLLADLRAEAVVPVFAQAPAFRAVFDAEDAATAWTSTGDVRATQQEPHRGNGSLRVARTLEKIDDPAQTVGPTFAVSPGRWAAAAAFRTDLHSPDSSYSGVLEWELLDASGKAIDRTTLVDAYGKKPWTTTTRIVDVPATATQARFVARLNKTYGTFDLDDLSAAYLAPAPKRDDRIVRALFSTAQLGNLLFPEDPRTVDVVVEARRPLDERQRTMKFVVRDYWGAEQGQASTVVLGEPEKANDRLRYAAKLDLAESRLAVGRYYEVHVEIAVPGFEPFRAATSLAVLSEAGTRKYRPEEVPFTARNWDNRITEYVKLVDRLGVRTCGLWGGWSPQPPHQPTLSQLELVRKLGMAWLTTTPCTAVERGKTEWTEQALREGARAFLEKYGREKPLVINLGNEPHGKGDKVLRNVDAYRYVFEEVKKFDPTIPVVATSVEPNEEYFQAGYGKYCDAFDFHIYEDSENVRRTIREYRALQEKYDCVKPIWSTELGLNSQGQTRHVVAVELFKKFATFFAAGGENVSWFGLLYPDPEGKSHGSSGDSHNVFDCRFNRYAPRLDAVAYYHAVNAIAIKRFVAERQYEDRIEAFLFRDRDGRALQIWWSKQGTHDRFVPLPGVGAVRLVRVDGREATLDAAGSGLTLSLGPDPILLSFDGAAAELPSALEPPAATIEHSAAPLPRATATKVVVTRRPERVAGAVVFGPPHWNVARATEDSAGATTEVRLTPPAETAIREVELVVELSDAKQCRIGELYRRLPSAD